MFPDSLRQTGISGNREPLMVNAEKQHQKHTEQKSGQSSPQKRDGHRSHIQHGPSPVCRQNPKRNRQQKRKKLRQNRKTQCRSKILRNCLQYWLVKEIRFSPVAPENPCKPIRILNQKRTVKSKFCIQSFYLLRSRFHTQKRRGRSSRDQVDYQKDHARYYEHYRYQGQYSFCNIR